MARVAGGKFGHAREGPQPLLTPPPDRAPRRLSIQRRNLRSPVVHPARDDCRPFPERGPCRVHARSGGDEQAHGRAGILNHGVDAKRGAEGGPCDLGGRNGALLEQRAQSQPRRSEQVFMIGGHLDGGDQHPAPQEHGVGVRPAHIQPEHDRALPFLRHLRPPRLARPAAPAPPFRLPRQGIAKARNREIRPCQRKRSNLY